MPKFLEHTPPNIAFFLGLLLGVAVASTVGFFMVVKNFQGEGGALAKVAGTSDTAPDTTLQGTPKTGPVTVSPVTEDDHIRGDKNASITLVEYSDLQCPYCQRFHETAQQLITEYAGKVRWVYRHWPLASHPEGRPAAIASECFAQQKGESGFWQFVDTLFTNQDTLGASLYTETATKLGANKSAFEKCVAGKETEPRVEKNYQLGITDGVEGTPGNFIIAPDGTVTDIQGAQPYEALKPFIDSLLGV